MKALGTAKVYERGAGEERVLCLWRVDDRRAETVV